MSSEPIGKRILVCAAHPDDETIGAGGTIARATRAGARVALVVFTKAYAPDWPKELIADKRREVETAAEKLGISDLRFLDHPAAKLDTIAQRELNDELRGVVEELRPDTVLTTHYGDVHADHRIVFEAVLVATRPLPGAPVRRVLAYELLSSTEWGAPLSDRAFLAQSYVDITSTLDAKLAALDTYASEVRDFPHPRSADAVSALAAKRGSEVGLAAAEAFQLIREVR